MALAIGSQTIVFQSMPQNNKWVAKNALVVLDHFHAKKYFNDAVDRVCKEELKRSRQQNNGELSATFPCFFSTTSSAKLQRLFQRVSMTR